MQTVQSESILFVTRQGHQLPDAFVARAEKCGLTIETAVKAGDQIVESGTVEAYRISLASDRDPQTLTICDLGFVRTAGGAAHITLRGYNPSHGYMDDRDWKDGFPSDVGYKTNKDTPVERCGVNLPDASFVSAVEKNGFSITSVTGGKTEKVDEELGGNFYLYQVTATNSNGEVDNCELQFVANEQTFYRTAIGHGRKMIPNSLIGDPTPGGEYHINLQPPLQAFPSGNILPGNLTLLRRQPLPPSA